MADLTKCRGTNCALKDSCFRYLAKANSFRQNYFHTPPVKDGKCEMYWKTKVTLEDELTGKNGERLKKSIEQLTDKDSLTIKKL